MAHILYHIFVIIMGATVALFLPYIMRFGAQKVLFYWSFIENEKIFLVSLEIAVAVGLIFLFSSIERYLRGRRIIGMAQAAGLESVRPPKEGCTQRNSQKKVRQGLGRDVMIIGSTGCRTLVSPEGEYHRVLLGCRGARILLLNPSSEGARSRAMSLQDAEITPEAFRDQVLITIDYLKGLWNMKRNVRLKLYPDVPLFKMIILGDYLYMKHYHPGKNVRDMPEFVFRHNQDIAGLYHPIYNYFLSRWFDPSIPEYDFSTDELVYRDRSENALRREKFGREPRALDNAETEESYGAVRAAGS